MILLDTDIFIDFLRGTEFAIKLIKENIDNISFSAITEAELLSGKECINAQIQEKILHLLSQFEKIPVDNPLVQVAASFRRKYNLEIPDAIIAASAFVQDITLITRNNKDFKKIKELKVRKPY